MDIEFVEKLIGLVERSRVTELDYAAGGVKVRIRRGSGTAPAHGMVRSETTFDRSAGLATKNPVEASAATDHTIAAGMIGTFFRSPGPGQPPFVSEGDTIEEGQTLGILEAMKMLNPVEADRPGRLLRVLVEDGVSVAAGTPLFTIALSGEA